MMRNGKYSAMLFGILVCLLSPLSTEADETPKKNSLVTAGIDLFHSESKGSIDSQIKVNLGPIDLQSTERGGFMGSYYWIGGLEGTVSYIRDAKLNNEPSWINLSTGLSWNLSKMKEASAPPTESAQPAELYDFNYGSASAKIEAQVETDNEIDNVNLVGGAQLVYTPQTAFDDVFLPPPSLVLAYEYVKPQSDDARKQLGFETSGFPRARAAILWNWAIGQKLTPGNDILKQVALQVHYRYYKEFDQSPVWIGKGFDEYNQLSGRLRYILAHKERKIFDIREVYVGYSSGREIAHMQDDKRIFLGITLQ